MSNGPSSDWTRLVDAVPQLKDLLLQKDFRPDFIVGVARSGLPIAAKLSAEFKEQGITVQVISLWPHPKYSDNPLNLAIKGYLKSEAKTRETTKVLVVDDICNTGRSLALAKDYLEESMDPRKAIIETAAIEYDRLRWPEAIHPTFVLGPSPDGAKENALGELEIAEPERYVDFDLHITSNGEATATSEEGEASAAIPVEVPSAIQQSLPQIEANEADSQQLKDFGQALYDLLFPGPIHTHFQVTEAVARNQGANVRIRLQVEALEIARLPLEFMCRKVGGYLAVDPDTVLSRYLQLPLPSFSVRQQGEPLHMLAIVADIPERLPLDPDEWEGILQTALARQLEGGEMTLRMVKRATRREIRTALLEQKPHIVQFVGHGYYESGAGHLALLDGDTGRIWGVDDEQFAGIFRGFDDHLGLVCLAACESGASDDPQGFRGIAPKLVEHGRPAVVAMQYKVPIPVAKVFLEEFYTFVAARQPLDWATQMARNQVAQQFGYDNRDFATPVLYMRARDGEVF